MSQSLTLYESEQYLAELADTEAVVTEEQLAEFAAELAKANEYGLTKRDNCIRFILHLKEQIAFSKAERKRLGEREAAIEAGLERFESYLLNVIGQYGKQTSPTIKRLEGRVGSLCAVDGSGAVEITDEAAVPMAYKTVTVKMPAQEWILLGIPEGLCSDVRFTTSASAIKAAIKEGLSVPGATLKYTESLLVK